MRVREFLQPAVVLGEGDTLAAALPWLALDNPVFVRVSNAWRVLLARDVVGFPESRLLLDCPAQSVEASAPDDDIEGLLEPDGPDVLPVVENDALIGQIDRRELREELRVLELGNPLVAPALLLARVAPALVHDLANALTAVRGSLPVAEYPGDPVVAAAAVEHAMRLVSYFRGLVTAGDEPVPEPLDLGEAIEGLRDLLRRVVGSAIRVEVETAAGLPRVRVPRRLVERVLLNLVLNARDAIRGAGVVRVEAAPGSDPSHVLLFVDDDGDGVPAALAEQIFLPGVTTKAGGGRGLGLAGVARALHRVGGRIGLEPVADRPGARMRVQLPV